MSNQPKNDGEKTSSEMDARDEPIIVDERNWEEDTAEVSPVQIAHVRESVGEMGGTEADSPESEIPDTEPPADTEPVPEGNLEVPSARAVEAPALSVLDPEVVQPEEEPPFDEELSDSMRPLPPSAPEQESSQAPELGGGDTDNGPASTVASVPLVEPNTLIRETNPLAPAHMDLPAHIDLPKRAVGIWYAGVFLWSYLVVGEYVVGANLPEFIGWSLFSGVIVGAFLQGANRLGTRLMMRVALLAVGSTVATLLFSTTLFGSSSRSGYQTVSACLLLVAVAAIIYGLREGRGARLEPARLQRITWLRVGIWLLFGGNTALLLAVFLSQV